MFFFIFITGDSDSAAFGARANTLLDMTSEERDVYFVSGTNADWQRQTSLANILLQYNPDLIGGAEYSGMKLTFTETLIL